MGKNKKNITLFAYENCPFYNHTNSQYGVKARYHDNEKDTASGALEVTKKGSELK